MNWLRHFVRGMSLVPFLVAIVAGGALAQLPSQAEYNALMDIYQQMGGQNWVHNNGWSTANPAIVQSVSGWYGIATDASGHVTHLDLDGIVDYSYYTNGQGIQEYPGNGLAGTIPASVGNLTWLRVLNFGGNSLWTALPTEIGNLTQLEMFVAANCQLTGGIPTSIGNCTKLRYIMLENNQLSGPIPATIGNLSELWALQLHYNQLTGSIPAEVGNLKKLVYFHLYGNQLSGVIPPQLGNMTTAGSIGLQNNNLSGSIPKELGRLKNLVVLYLSYNQLTGAIPDSLSRMTNLSLLELSDNSLSGVVPASLAGIAGLGAIEISGNALTFADIQQLKSIYQGDLSFGIQEISLQQSFTMNPGDSVQLTTSIDRNVIPSCTYQWYSVDHGPISEASDNGFSTYVSEADLIEPSGQFYCVIRNSALHSWGSVKVATFNVKVQYAEPSYIRTITVLSAGKTSSEVDDPVISDESLNIDYTYFDGLGRPIQTVLTRRSPNGNDVVSPLKYDEYGRQNRSYLPIVMEDNGRYKQDRFIFDQNNGYAGKAKDFYSNSWSGVEGDNVPYSLTVFEPSPLNRPLKNYGPGEVWSPSGLDKPITHQYLVNLHDASAQAIQGERIIAWHVNENGILERSAPVANFVEPGGYYSSSQLNIKVTIDESGHSVREYTNKQGQVILKKVQATVVSNPPLNDVDSWACTYYIYDDLDNLVFVIQPEGYKQYMLLNQN